MSDSNFQTHDEAYEARKAMVKINRHLKTISASIIELRQKGICGEAGSDFARLLSQTEQEVGCMKATVEEAKSACFAGNSSSKRERIVVLDKIQVIRCMPSA